MDERTGAEPFPPGTGSSTSHSGRLRGVFRRRWSPRRVLAASSLALLLPACPAAVPAANPNSAPAAAPASCSSMYTVVSGDSWFQIAKKSSVAMSALLTANGATTSTALFPGMQLCLPQGSTATTAPAGSATTVAPGALPVQLASFPVQGPCWFIDSFMAPRGGGRLHEGVDLIAAAGQYVYAAADGRLTKQTLDKAGSLSGNAWWLTADDGTYFFYAHLSDFAPGLRPGSRVRAGEIIGFVGSTGNSATAHLHFEVHPYGGDPINPYPTVRAAGGCRTGDGYAQPNGWVPVD